MDHLAGLRVLVNRDTFAQLTIQGDVVGGEAADENPRKPILRVERRAAGMALKGVDIGDEEIEVVCTRVSHCASGVDLGGQAASEADHREGLSLIERRCGPNRGRRVGAFDGPVELDDGKVGRLVGAEGPSLRHDLSARVDVFVSDLRKPGRILEMVVEDVGVVLARHSRVDAVTRREDQVVIDEHARAGGRGRLIPKQLVVAELEPVFERCRKRR